MVHWTYAERVDPQSDLEQGDILEPSPALRAVLRTVHPHFQDPKYVGFLIASQTCDLVRRPVSKARYINLAVIRPLVQVTPQLLQQALNPIREGLPVFAQRDKAEARRLFERILDQNEQALGLFYLHGESAIGINDPAVALLRVTVALKAEHYPMLVEARRGRLDPSFQSKLGWLLGNLYARPATPDWQERGQPNERKKLVNLHVEGGGGAAARWLDDVVVDAFKRAREPLTSEDPDEIVTALNAKHRPKTAMEILCDAAAAQARKIFANASDDQLEKLKNRLKNDQAFNQIARRADKSSGN